MVKKSCKLPFYPSIRKFKMKGFQQNVVFSCYLNTKEKHNGSIQKDYT